MLAVRLILSRGGYREAHLTRNERGALTVRGHLDSSEVTLLIDRRVPATFLDREAVARLGYEPRTTNTEVNLGGGSEPLYALTISTVTIGGLQLDSVEWQVTRVAPFVRASGLPPSASVAGIIGADMLMRCGAILDMPQDILYLHAPDPLPQDTTVADTADSTGGDILKTIGDRIKAREKKIREKNDPKP